MVVTKNDTKTVLFFPLNSPGHINSSLGIADRLQQDYGYRTVFLLLGPMMGKSIEENGHELIIMEEATVLEDYEIESDEDNTSEPVNDELKRAQGKNKVKFPGVLKWPHLIMRYEHLFKLEPVQAFIQSLSIMEKYMVDELIENHDNYARMIETIKPDLIVIDAYYIPPCVVGSKIPWVRLYSANPLMIFKSKLDNGLKPPPMTGFPLMTKEKRLKMRNEEPEKWEAIIEQWRAAMDKIIQSMSKAQGSLELFLDKHGLPRLEKGQQAHDSPNLNLYMYPKELDYDQDDDLFEPSARWFRSDSLIRKPFDQSNSEEAKYWSEKLAIARKGKKHVVFFSLGSIASGNVKLMKQYIEFFKDDHQRLYVISKGIHGDKYELNSSNMIGGNYIPQCFFLENANLAIIHGGNNSVTECLYYGIPSIVLPVFADQLDNGQRIQDLGLGKRLDIHNCTKEQIRNAIDEILDNQKLIERVSEIGKTMQARSDSRKISKMLKKLVDEGKLEQSFIEDSRNKNFDDLQA